MNVFKLSTINNLNIYFLFIFSNYFIYFCFKEKLFFLFFSILIILVFLFTIIKNFKENKLIISIFILFCLISLSSPVADWDARSIWLFNAKIIFFESSLGNYFSYSPYYNHIDYPIFVPVLSATLATIINGWNEIFPKFSTLILALPPLIILSKISKKFLSKLVLLILILFIYEKRIINGEVDAILALYSILLIELLKNFFNIKKENNPSFGHLIIILFNIIFLTLIKFEGSVIALTILASFLSSTTFIGVMNSNAVANIYIDYINLFLSVSSFMLSASRSHLDYGTRSQSHDVSCKLYTTLLRAVDSRLIKNHMNNDDKRDMFKDIVDQMSIIEQYETTIPEYIDTITRARLQPETPVI